MTKDEKMPEVSNDLVMHDTDYMNAFRRNVLQQMENKDITLNHLAEQSGLSVDTLKSFLYKDLKDCKLSTAVSLAKALDVSIDRLVGAGTMKPVTLECLEIVGQLPPNEYNFLVWYIKRLGNLYSHEITAIPNLINVITPKCANGTLIWSNEWSHETIEHCEPDIRTKCFMGLRIPCVHYMPIYNNGDILLIAQDRQPANGEHCVIDVNNNLYVARCVRVGGEYHFHSIVNSEVNACFANINKVIGYVAHVIRE